MIIMIIIMMIMISLFLLVFMNIILAHRCCTVFQFSFLKVGINYCPLNECCEN